MTDSPGINLATDKGRLSFFDNAKFILIFFVVWGHLLSSYQESNEFSDVLWAVLNTCHMPTMLFISGFFAKSYVQADNSIKVKRIFSYLLPYLAAQIAITLFERFVFEKRFTPSFFTARGSLWFLQVLIIWHLILPVVVRFKPWVVMTSAVLIALAVGYDKNCGNFMALSRAFVHFPFFMAGYYCGQKRDALMTYVNKKKLKPVAVLIVICVALMFWLIPQTRIDAIIKCNTAYFSIKQLKGMNLFLMWVPRAAFYIVAVLLAASFLVLCPKRKTFFSKLGTKTLSVYIWHRFPFQLDEQFGWYKLIPGACGVVLFSVAAVVLTFLFSFKPFTIPFDAIKKINLDFLLKKDKTDS